MAAQKDSTRVELQNIKIAVASISTCTPATVETLERLLSDDSRDPAQKENLKPTRTKPTTTTATSRRRGAAKAADNTGGDAVASKLSTKERYVLATDVANATLKSLSDSLKNPAILRTAQQPAKPKAPSSKPNSAIVAPKQRRTLSRSSSYSQRPLSEQSLSQAVNSPRKRSTLRRSSSFSSCVTSGPPPGLIATGECARVAFAYLRSQETGTAGSKDTSQLQVENGMLALIGKFIAHGLDNLAIKELRILKKRLDTCLTGPQKEKVSKARKGPAVARKGPTSAEKDTLASLLEFDAVDPQSPALALVISHQLYTLRMIGTFRRPRIIESVVDYFQDSNGSCPVNLILQLARSPKLKAKAARQLESLAQTLLSLCPSVSTVDDEMACKDKLRPSPDAVFRLQHLAFRIRQQWWRLSDHQGNLEKELCEPFSKCLCAFARRSALPATAKYNLAKTLFKDLFDQLDTATTLSITPSMALASKTLSSLAQAASLTKEALTWTEACGSSDASKDSAAKSTARLIRIAALSFEGAIKNSSIQTWEDALDKAFDALASSLGGSSTELDGLFAEVNGFRRTATKTLMTLPSPDLLRRNPSFYPRAISIIAASMQFVLRYIGSKSAETPDPKSREQQNRRIGIARKIIKGLIDSAIICSKQFSELDVAWPAIDLILQDCTSILQRVLDYEDRRETSSSQFCQDMQLPFVKISNAYWTSYLQLRRAADNAPYLLQAMRRSVDVLLPRSKQEWQSGLLQMKLEKLGEAFDACGRSDEARVSFHQSIECVIKAMDIPALEQLSAKYPLQSIFDINGDCIALGRLLRLYHYSFIKDSIKNQDDLAFFDDDTLAATIRGLILEWQLTLFLKTLARNRPWDNSLNSSMRELCTRLLELYSPTDFPVRRRRALIALLELGEEHPDIIPPELLEMVIDSESRDVAGTLDESLSRYDGHLGMTLKIKLTLRAASPFILTIKEALTFWHSVIYSSKTWEDILGRIDNTDRWLQQLHAIGDYLAVKGEEYLCIPVLNLLSKALELRESSDLSQLLSTLSKNGLQLLRLGYSGKAGSCFAKAENLVLSDATSIDAKLQWHLAYAEYLLEIGETEQCETILRSAESAALNNTQFMELSKTSATLSGRVRFNTILAEACYVYSLLALKRGCYQDALRYARRSVALSRRVWAALENKPTTQRNMHTTVNDSEGGHVGSSFDPLSSIRTDKGVPVVMSVTHQSLNGADFWPLVPLLHRALSLQSAVFSHLGLVQEAVYMAEQAEKVASAIRSSSLILESASHRIEYWAQSGRPDKALSVMHSVEHSLISKHLSIVQYYSSVARLHHSNKEFGKELEVLGTMSNLLKDLQMPSFLRDMEFFEPSVDALTASVSRLSLEAPQVEEKKPARVTRGRKAVVKPVAKPVTKRAIKPPPKIVRKTAAPAKAPEPSISEAYSQLNSLSADVSRRRAIIDVLQDNVLEATELLEQAAVQETGTTGRIHQLCANFKVLFAQSIKEIARDFTFNTLLESTIAFPATFQPDQRFSEGVLAKMANLTIAQRPCNGDAPQSQSGRGKKTTKANFVATLQKAKEIISEAYSLASRVGSSASLTQVSSALSNVIVLLSAATQGDVKGALHPLYSAYMAELPKCLSLKMTQAAIDVEQESPSREEFLKWPEAVSQQAPSLPSVSQFQQDYIDIIPDAWTAISLALSEDHDELYITRYHAGQSPFVLRLPMSRHKSRDMDEDEFGFDEGRKDFDEIIELSDFSTKSAREMTAKGAKTQWWAEREALDTRLKELLINIENIWLGGFKGIFSHRRHDPEQLAKFKKSFQNILDRNLPSRRGRGQKKKINLEPRILELFVGLGDATNEELDLDEALMDLVYFVVDILQFNGETNAYDEIDFDAIVIETLDALRVYHNACHNTPSKPLHTILILDKNLHVFPWESLPCLQSLSISRLPSLAALRERIIAAKAPRSTHQHAQPGHYISAFSGGASMLNPSGDLTHTFKTLKPRLDSMSGSWTHILNRAPSEAEFSDALSQKDLVLYFGHGSGAQFVRSKTVKRLYQEKCATTFLFGCSSAHLTENGIYEPSGMLASYLAAGAPAVVGMLWDVTDKDCDRFAVRAGELWGLWPEIEDPGARGSKGKGKATTAEVESVRGAGTARKGRKNVVEDEEGMDLVGGEEGRRGVGLDEAVREARGACVLRYLNGAAAVVYGIPVYLE